VTCHVKIELVAPFIVLSLHYCAVFEIGIPILEARVGMNCRDEVMSWYLKSNGSQLSCQKHSPTIVLECN